MQNNGCKKWVTNMATQRVCYVVSVKFNEDRILLSRSRSHITTDGQSVSSSWCLAPFEAGDQMLHLFE
jgi:hypothetical protein